MASSFTDSFGKVRQLPRLPAELDNMHAGIGAVDDVDVASVVDLDVVGLNRDLALFGAAGLAGDAALVGLVGDRRYVIADLLRALFFG